MGQRSLWMKYVKSELSQLIWVSQPPKYLKNDHDKDGKSTLHMKISSKPTSEAQIHNTNQISEYLIWFQFQDHLLNKQDKH